MPALIKGDSVGFVAEYYYTKTEIAYKCGVPKDTVEKWANVTGRALKGKRSGPKEYLEPGHPYAYQVWHKGEDILSFLVKTHGWKYIKNSLKE